MTQDSDRIHTLCFFFFFFIRTSNFGAEAERSFIFLRFEAENVLNVFLNYIVHTLCILINHRTRPGNLSKCIACRDIVSRTADYDKLRCLSPFLM